jgi:hypothetical protein
MAPGVLLLVSQVVATAVRMPVVAGWTTHGPSSSFVSQIVLSPGNPEELFVLADGNVFKSRDRGLNWIPAFGVPAYVYSLVFDPLNPSAILAGTVFGLFKSLDGGSTWSPRTNVDGLTSVFEIVFDPTHPTRVYARVDSHSVLRSVDSGETWEPANRPSTALVTSPTAMAVDPSGALFVAFEYYGIFRSDNGGASWVSPGQSLAGFEITQIRVDPISAGTLYAAAFPYVLPSSPGGVLKSVDGGLTWTLLNKGLGEGAVRVLAIDPEIPGTLYAGSMREGVSKSVDGGLSWNPMNAGLLPRFPSTPDLWIVALALEPGTDTVWIGVASRGFFESNDGGAFWRPANEGLPGLGVFGLAVDAGASQSIYAGVSRIGSSSLDSGIFHSSDAGSRWALVSVLPGLAHLTALAADPRIPGTLYVGSAFCSPRGPTSCGGDISKSVDGGVSWRASLQDLGWVRAIAVDPKDSNLLYTSTFTNSPYGSRSVDGGATWIPMGDGFPSSAVVQFLIDPVTPGTVYAGSAGAGFFRSMDAGATWKASSTGLTSLDIKALASDLSGSALFAGTAVGIFKSLDGGQSWGGTAFADSVNALAVHPKDAGTIYAGTSAGVFETRDGGVSWEPINHGLADLDVHSLVLDSEGLFLHAATNSGVFDLRIRRRTIVIPPRDQLPLPGVEKGVSAAGRPNNAMR